MYSTLTVCSTNYFTMTTLILALNIKGTYITDLMLIINNLTHSKWNSDSYL